MTTAIADPDTTTGTAPADTTTEPGPDRVPMVGPIAADASITAVLSWAASMASLTTTPPGSLDVEMAINTVTITLPTRDAYREWRHMLAAPPGTSIRDTLGALAHTQTRIGGWVVVLVCHLEVPDWAQS